MLFCPSLVCFSKTGAEPGHYGCRGRSIPRSAQAVNAPYCPSHVHLICFSTPQVGLAGQAPGLLGLLSADLAVGAVAGATAVLSFGTLVPHLAGALGRRGGRAVVSALLLASVGVAGWASVRLARPFRCGLGW